MIKLSAFADEASNALSGQIEALKRNGLSLIDVRNIEGKSFSDILTTDAKEYRKKLNDNGIDVWMAGSPLGKVDIDVNFTEYKETAKHIFSLANVFGTDKIRMFSFFNAYDKPEKVIERLNELVSLAREYNVTLYHENEKDVFGDKLERVLYLQKNVEGLKFLYDPANYVACGENVEGIVQNNTNLHKYFHIKDVVGSTDENVPAGLGDGQINELIKWINFDTVLTIEPHLSIFEGYATIDKSEFKSKFSYSSNDESFDDACNHVKKIILASGYIEKNGNYIMEGK